MKILNVAVIGLCSVTLFTSLKYEYYGMAVLNAIAIALNIYAITL